jgi:hypothetical protein
MTDECMKKHMENMTPEMIALHQKIEEAHKGIEDACKDMSPEDIRTFHEIMEQMPPSHGMDDVHHGMAVHQSKLEEMDAKLDKIMKALNTE